jgi:hypothetical protein
MRWVMLMRRDESSARGSSGGSGPDELVSGNSRKLLTLRQHTISSEGDRPTVHRLHRHLADQTIDGEVARYNTMQQDPRHSILIYLTHPMMAPLPMMTPLIPKDEDGEGVSG